MTQALSALPSYQPNILDLLSELKNFPYVVEMYRLHSFVITCANGWVVSVSCSPASACEHEGFDPGDATFGPDFWFASHTAEIAAWHTKQPQRLGGFKTERVGRYKTPSEILSFVVEIAALGVHP